MDNLANLALLILGRNQLNGSIPLELGNLAKLAVLDLAGNQLSGSIPPELGNLENLQGLFLFDNQLSGSIPHELCGLTSLVLETFNTQIEPCTAPTPLAKSASGCNTVTGIPMVECEALVSLYHSTDGDDWKRNSSWLTADTPCDLGRSDLQRWTCQRLRFGSLTG